MLDRLLCRSRVFNIADDSYCMRTHRAGASRIGAGGAGSGSSWRSKDCARWDSHDTFEGSAERSVGSVAVGSGNLGNALSAAAECGGGQPHA